VINVEDKNVILPHTLIIDGRKSISVTGVTEADNFNDEEIILFTSQGQITIRGENLQISVLNTDSGEVAASGKVNSVSYSDRTEKHQSFFGKVFR
jgi:sporulation protein YabP